MASRLAKAQRREGAGRAEGLGKVPACRTLALCSLSDLSPR